MRSGWNAIVAEMGGTFLFFFVGVGSVATSDRVVGLGGDAPGLIVIALAHGLVLAVLVSALGSVSGGHFNPAVTFGVWVAGHIPARRAAAYVVAQLTAGCWQQSRCARSSPSKSHPVWARRNWRRGWVLPRASPSRQC